MFEVTIGGEPVKAEVTFYTAQLYEVEFGKDIIKDLFGAQTLELSETENDDKVLSIDFTKTNWVACAKCLWAAIKTADESTPSYTRWMKETSGVNMWLVSELIAAEVADCFFRPGSAGEEAEEQQ